MNKKNTLIYLSVIWSLKLISISLTVWFLFGCYQDHQIKSQQKRLKAEVDSITKQLNTDLELLEIATNEYYNQVKALKENNSSLLQLDSLRKISIDLFKNERHKFDFFGMGYCLKTVNGYKSLFVKRENKEEFSAAPLSYSLGPKITDKNRWYHKLLSNDSSWIDPYYGADAHTNIAEFGRILEYGDTSCLVYFDYSLFDIKNIVEKAVKGLPNTVFGYLLSPSGKIIYHPDGVIWKRKHHLDISVFAQNQNDNCNLCEFTNYIHCRSTNANTDQCEENYLTFLKQRGEIKKEANSAEGSIVSYKIIDRNQKDSRVFKKLKQTGWYFVLIFPDYETNLDDNTKRKALLATIAFFLFFELLLFIRGIFKTANEHQVNNTEVLHLSVFFSISFFLNLVAMCIVSYSYPKTNEIQRKTDNVNLVRHEDCSHAIVSRCLDQNSPDPVNIGLQLEVLSIRNAHELQLGGYYWIKKPKINPKNFKGDITPDPLREVPKSENHEEDKKDEKSQDTIEVDSTLIKIQVELKKWLKNENYRKSLKKQVYFPDLMENRTELLAFDGVKEFDNGGDTIQYKRFEIVLKQDFNYSRFPFDSQIIKVRIRHEDFWNKQFLIPDFENMVLSKMKNRIGLDNKVDLEEWNITETSFAYATLKDLSRTPFTEGRRTYFDSTYCMGTYADTAIATKKRQMLINSFKPLDQAYNYPEFFYIMKIKRQYFRPLIGFMLPLVVILVLLYFYVLRIDLYKPGNFLDEASALLFTLLISHFALREYLPFKGLIYIEFFYFIAYFSIIIYLVNRNVYFSNYSEDSKKTNPKKGYVKLIIWKGNLAAKALYWPITLILFIATSLYFFI